MINVRKKFASIIEKNNEYQDFIIRHLSNDKCKCITQEPMVFNALKGAEEINKTFRTVPDPDCNICGGSGYIYEEFLFRAMFFFPSFRVAHFEDMSYATTEQNILTCYLRPHPDADTIHVNDLLFNVDCEVNGALKQPILRTKKWIIIEKQPIRLDNNKLEYIKLFAKPAIL
jgi:hypothetical protein